MLSISGLQRFYYLPNFHDTKCKYDRVHSIIHEQFRRELQKDEVFITGKILTVSSVRMKKFCVTTEFDAKKAHSSGFKPPFTLDEASPALSSLSSSIRATTIFSL